MYSELLKQLHSIRDTVEGVEPSTDSQAVLLIDLNNALARADRILRAFEADEQK